jgi:hypothetical protein
MQNIVYSEDVIRGISRFVDSSSGTGPRKTARNDKGRAEETAAFQPQFFSFT